jgi:hypothetical protein
MMNRFLCRVGNSKPIRSFFWAVTVSLVLCTSSYAVPLSYTLHGYLIDDQGQQNQVSGSMVIESTLINRATDSYYQISQFSLSTPNFSYQGGDGSLWFGTPDVAAAPYDLMWGLLGSIGTDSYNWVGEEFSFCNADGTPYSQLSQYSQLAPMIELWGPDYDTAGAYARNGEIVASLDPIPERSTIFLLIFGLVLFAGARRTKLLRVQH